MNKTFRLIASMALGCSLLAPIPPAMAATTYKPGNTGFGVQLDANTKFGDTNETHPCAGRKLAYHSHIDAIYASHYDNELTTMIVDGQVPTPADQLCVRLAPDANPKGEEVSRFVVPFDNPSLGFLGKPGDIVWHAPQEVNFMDSWRPVWAGAGAFDPHHEYTVPTDFVDNKVTMELVEKDGPGEVEQFFYNRSVDQPHRMFSTRDNIMSFPLNVGSHGHYSWTFSEAGVYHLTWVVRGKKTDGSEEVSKPVTTTWLVGSDEEVGLKPGTTTELAPITKSAEAIRDELAKVANPTSTTAPTGPANPDVYTQSKDQVHKLLWTSNPYVLVQKGHQDMGLFGAGEDAKAQMHDDVTGDHRSTTFAYAVPNSALRSIPGKVAKDLGGICAGWLLPQAQDFDLPWQGFSTQNFDYSKITKDGVSVSISEFKGPGRMVTAHDSLSSTTVALDSADLTRTVQYAQPSHDHQTFVFTQPGAYRVTYTFDAKTTDGQTISKDIVAFYLVGDSALWDAAEVMEFDRAVLGFSEPQARDTTPECVAEPEPAPSTSLIPTTGPNAPATSVEKPVPTEPTPPVSGGSGSSEFFDNPEAVGLFIAGSFLAAKTIKHIADKHDHRDDNVTDSERKTKPRSGKNQAPALAAPMEPRPNETKTAGASGSATGASGDSSAKSGASSAKANAGGSSKNSNNNSSGTKSGVKTKPTKSAALGAKSTAKPSPTPAPNANSGVRALSNGSNSNSTEQTDPQLMSEQRATGLTAGGWLAGFILGIGVMALLGGLGLFVATYRTLRQVRGVEEFTD